MITRNFIKQVHDAFNALNYHVKRTISQEKFEEAAIKTLIHCKSLSDAIHVVNFYRFCLKHWSKIEKIFKKYLTEFNELKYTNNTSISLVSDEEALGVIYITNGINNKVKDVIIASQSFGGEASLVDYRFGKFIVFDDWDYCLKYSKISSNKMKIFNREMKCVCNIVKDKKDLIYYLEHNSTPYQFCNVDNTIQIYDKAYFDSLNENDEIDQNKMIADINWDILEPKSELGVAMLTIYEDVDNAELLLLFAMSTFLIFQQYMSNLKIKQAAAIGVATNMSIISWNHFHR